jgi:hypothetical protein
MATSSESVAVSTPKSKTGRLDESHPVRRRSDSNSQSRVIQSASKLATGASQCPSNSFRTGQNASSS